LKDIVMTDKDKTSASPAEPPMLAQLRTAVLAFLALTLVTGALYPLLVTGLAKVAFREQAEGSLLRQGDRVVGSRLIGQPFGGDRYFWSRPSATTPAYNAAGSGASNLGPTNEALTKAVGERVAALRAAHPDQTGPVPVDLVTTSASGLDPHISPAGAAYQVARVARARGLDAARVQQLVAEATEPRALGLLGEPGVNVLALNLKLDAAP
jgi:K+-transporting ATPase ATPase C chain